MYLDIASTFFDPDDKMVDWIIKYANGRSIVDIGFGNGHLLKKLVKHGARSVMGLEMMFDSDDYMNLMTEFRKIQPDSDPSIHIFPYDVNSPKNILLNLPNKKDKFLFILARPCHHDDLIFGSIKCAGDAELLYIGLPKNFERDLDNIDYDIIQHDGTSKDGEVVLQIIKR